MEREKRLKRKIKILLWLFVFGLAVSGLTAFPLEWELGMLNGFLQRHLISSALSDWISRVYHGIAETNLKYPFLPYGTDWLAFAHLVIAIAFIGPIKDPVKNIWIVEWGIIASVLVIPLALIAGSIRHIPFFHQLIDCSFGVVGFIILRSTRNSILHLQKIKNDHSY